MEPELRPTTPQSSIQEVRAEPASKTGGPALGLQNITFFASKKGGKVKNWKARHWLFEPSGGMLSYYEDQNLKVRKGHVDLSQCKAIGPVRHDRIPHTLGLRTKDRLWVLAFDTADEMGRIQTLLGAVVQGSLEAQDVPVSALTKLKRGLTKKSSKNSATSSASTSSGTSNVAQSSSSGHKDHSSSNDHRPGSPPPSHVPPASVHPSKANEDSSRPGTSSDQQAAHANEKAALSSLNQNLNRIKEYTGKEFTLECDMSIVRARLETDHPEKKYQPGDIIYAGFMNALASKLQEICDYPLYREVFNHKCSSRIAIRVSDDEADKQKSPSVPFMRLDKGTLVIVCHRSLLCAPLHDLGYDLLDVLSIGEPLHVGALKDIEDHKQGVKSCLIRIQSNLGVTFQFECDYTEAFRAVNNVNPAAAKLYATSFGEIVFKYLETVTARLLKLASDPGAMQKFVASVTSGSIRVQIVANEDQARNAWVTTDGGNLNLYISAHSFAPDLPITYPNW